MMPQSIGNLETEPQRDVSNGIPDFPMLTNIVTSRSVVRNLARPMVVQRVRCLRRLS
jgi:hypothetical protein